MRGEVGRLLGRGGDGTTPRDEVVKIGPVGSARVLAAVAAET